MKKLLNILFLLANILTFYTISMEVNQLKIDKQVSTLYKFFNIEKFQNLPEEVKCIIAQQYGQWWYNPTIFHHSFDGLVNTTKFNYKSNKVLIGFVDLLQNCVIELFNLQGELLKRFAPFEGIFGITKILAAFDPQDKYMVTAVERSASQDFLLRSWDLDGNVIGQLHMEGSILSLAINSQGQIVVITRSPQGIILADGLLTARWYDINFNNIKILQCPYPDVGLCNLVKLDQDANKVLLHFDNEAVINKSKLVPSCIKYLNRVIKWELNEEEEEEILGFEHGTFVSSIGLSNQGDKVLTSFLNEIKLWDWNGNNLATFIHVDNPTLKTNFIEKCQSISNSFVSLLEFSPDGKFILTAFSRCKTAKLWDLKGNKLIEFPHGRFITNITFNFQGDKLLIGSFEKTALWVLYKNPTLEQVLLKRLIQIYLLTEKLSKEIQSPEILFNKIVVYFKAKGIELDEDELNYIWNTLPQEIRNSLFRPVGKSAVEFREVSCFSQ